MISFGLAPHSFAQTSSAAAPKPLNNVAQNDGQTSAYRLAPALYLDLARSADSGGDAAFTLDQYQQAYEEAKARMVGIPIGTSRWIGLVREASAAGYYLAWGRLDQGNRAAANDILDHLTTLLAPFDVSTPRKELRISIARLAWIKSRIASEEDRADEDSRLKARTLQLTEGFRDIPNDYGPLAKLRITALWSTGTWEEVTANRTVACDLAREIEGRVPGQMLNRLLECDQEEARVHLAARRFDEAKQAQKKLEKRYLDAESRDQVELYDRMLLIRSFDTLVKVGTATKRPEDSARAQLRAAELTISVLKGATLFQQNTNQIWDVFSVFSNMELKDIPEFSDSTAANKKAADIFSRLLDAVEPTQRFYPGSRSISAMLANTASLAANAKLKLNQPLEALGFANRGLQAIENIKFHGKGTEYSEMGTVICLTNGRALEAMIKLERTDEAIAAFAKFQQRCGEWLQAYPWDFYSRQHMTAGASKLGLLLVKTGRTTEALPILRYASDWGVKDASSALAGIYRALPTSPENSASADLREALATRQSMKRFTVPTDFAGVKWPFHVYVSEFGPGTYCPADRALKPDEQDCIGFRGIDDQVAWVKEARGGMVPADVVSAFQKLSDIARKNNVSLPDLVVYALGAANSASANAEEAAAIHAEMLRANFWRNPYRASDEGGLALRGFDPVSYSQGTEPKVGLAAHFALWDGALWLFSTAENRTAFLAQPGFYAPQYGGFCSICMAEGKAVFPDPSQFIYQNNKVTLFSDEGQKKAWNEASPRLARQAEFWWLMGMKSENPDQRSEVAAAILKFGSVRGPSDLELTRASLPRRTLLIERLSGIPEAAPVLIGTLGSRSWTYALLNRPIEALADADRALALDPNQPWIIGNKANALLMLNRIGEALTLLTAIKDELAADKETPMCNLILEDVATMRENSLLPAATADRVLAELRCKVHSK